MTIRFDLDELKERMKNKLEIKIPEETRTQITETFEYLKTNKKELLNQMKWRYEKFIKWQNMVEKNPDNQELAKKSALAEDEYNTFKEKVET